MIPLVLPSNCVVDPAGIFSNALRLATCLAPIVEKESVGRIRAQSCQDQRLRQQLFQKSWDPDIKNGTVIAIAKRRQVHKHKRNINRKHYHVPENTKWFRLLFNFENEG